MSSVAGRPKIVWTDEQYRQFEKLCAIHCTIDDICGVMDVTDKTLTRLLRLKYKLDFSACFKKFSSGGKVSLRRKQFEGANSGNVSMLIWLGKQHLGQSDKTENISNSSQAEKNHADLVSAIKELSRADQ